MGPEKDNEFAGVGGSYVVGRDGTRKRVEETRDHPEGNRPRDPEGKAIVAPPPQGDQPGLPAPAGAKPWQAAPEDKPAKAAATAAAGTATSAETVKKGA